MTINKSILSPPVPDNFKPPSLVTFDRKSDPHEHVTFINTHMAIISLTYSLKCKLLSRTIKEENLRWYMTLPNFFVTSYQDLSMKVVQ